MLRMNGGGVARVGVVAACLAAAAVSSGVAQEPGGGAAGFWPEWRGPLHSGVAPAGDPPVTWSESSNVRWKLELPGLGSATPVIWGDRLFVLTAAPTGERASSGPGFFSRLADRFMRRASATDVQQFVVLAIDRRDGSVLWERMAREAAPHQGRHGTNTWASPSAVTDGEVVCASFGSVGLYCYDLDGRLLWEADLGDMRTKMGFGEGRRRPSTGTCSSCRGTTRASRSSPPSTSGRGASAGGRRATRRPRGAPRS